MITQRSGRPLFLLGLMILLFLPSVAMADLKVVTTLPDFGAMSRAILQDDGETIVLVRSGEDPHFVDPRPSFARHLNRADLLVYAGMELEIGWLPTLLTRARNPRIQAGQPGHLDGSRYVQAQGVPTGAVDRSMGDVHPGGNPHYTTDPRQMARLALAFGERLGQLEPAKAEVFMDRARDFARENIRFAQRWEQKFAELPREARQIVGYHNAWDYVVSWLGLEMPITLEPKPGVPPNPRHMRQVIDTIDARKIGVIMQLEYYSLDAANQVARRVEHDVTVLSVPAQASSDETYLEHLEKIVAPLYEAMQSFARSQSSSE